MRVVLTIPDDVVTVEVYVKSKNEAITYSRIFEGGSITNSRFIDKEETMRMRYTEGLEKRIDAIEAELREEIPRRFGVAHETFVKLDEKVEALGRTVDSLDKWTDATDGQLKSIEGRLANLERAQLASETIQFEKGKDFKDAPGFIFNGEEKPCVIAEGLDAEAFKSLPKSTGEVDATANRGVYTDILRRLKELEERAKVSRPTWEYFNKLVERIEGLEGRVEPIESLLDKGEDGAYPFVPTVKDYAEIMRQIDALEKDAKTSRPTWDNFSLHDQRICKLESRMEDAEKKAAIAESVRKQLSADIKAIQGRINKICEETCVDA